MRYVDAEKELAEMKFAWYPQDMGTTNAIGMYENFLKNAPSADVAPVVHAHWIYGQNCAPYCSECSEDCLFDGSGFIELSDYCPWCGAKMDGDA